MKRKRYFLLFFLLAAILVSVLPVSASAASKYRLVKDGKNIYCRNKNNKLVKDRFVTIKNKTYYFDEDGRMLRKTVFDVDGKTYCAMKDGALAKNRIVTYKKKKYFFDAKGVRKTGFVTFNGRTYYFLKEGGFVKNAWKKVGGSYYYFGARGYMYRSGWAGDYYVDDSGRRTGVKSKEPKKVGNVKTLSMKNILQNPELPTGCESVSLTMVLNYYGFNLGKTAIASSYLPKSSSGNFVTAFAGDPFSSHGMGIYAPGLKDTANKFLKAKKSSLRAYDVSGMSLARLYRFLNNNTPVIVWNSMYMRTPVPYSFTYQTLGKSWRFYMYEHCVVLMGYNKTKNQVLINDPLSGMVWRDVSSFERIYNTLGKMAVVIQ